MARKYQLTPEEQTLLAQIRQQISRAQELAVKTQQIADVAQNELNRLVNVHKGGLDYLAAMHGITQGTYDTGTNTITSTEPEAAVQGALTIQDITDGMFLKRCGISPESSN